MPDHFELIEEKLNNASKLSESALAKVAQEHTTLKKLIEEANSYVEQSRALIEQMKSKNPPD